MGMAWVLLTWCSSRRLGELEPGRTDRQEQRLLTNPSTLTEPCDPRGALAECRGYPGHDHGEERFGEPDLGQDDEQGQQRDDVGDGEGSEHEAEQEVLAGESVHGEPEAGQRAHERGECGGDDSDEQARRAVGCIDVASRRRPRFTILFVFVAWVAIAG